MHTSGIAVQLEKFFWWSGTAPKLTKHIFNNNFQFSSVYKMGLSLWVSLEQLKAHYCGNFNCIYSSGECFYDTSGAMR